jgi:hypothetical protein
MYSLASWYLGEAKRLTLSWDALFLFRSIGWRSSEQALKSDEISGIKRLGYEHEDQYA